MLTCGDHEIPTFDSDGEDGKFSFVCLENGYFVPTREWDLIKRVQSGKMSINLQMKLWSETMWDRQLQCPLLFPPELWEYCRGYPEWVFQGVIQQTKKRVFEDIGFIPTWLKRAEKG